MAAWPESLPGPLLDGYSISQVDPVIRSTMDSGAMRSRRRSASIDDLVSCSVSLTAAQFREFRTWFNSEEGADGGASWFDVTLFTGVGSSTEELVSAKFSSIWTTKQVHSKDRITISMPLLVRHA